jgi:Fe-S-cluster-containing hydrogenase component 2
MSQFSQKELASGKVRFGPGEQVPNVQRKLFALQNLCTDCRICEVACALIHSTAGELNPLKARLKIEHAPRVAAGDGFGFMPAICHHCANPPPCAVVCPTDAFYYDPLTRAAVIEQSQCIQCMECVPACPFDAIYVGPAGEVLKCDLCEGDPACVKACATRPEMLNAGKQHARLPVLFFEDKASFGAILRRKPEGRQEKGMMEAMLSLGD